MPFSPLTSQINLHTFIVNFVALICAEPIGQREHSLIASNPSSPLHAPTLLSLHCALTV
jgi:hypothetical protein